MSVCNEWSKESLRFLVLYWNIWELYVDVQSVVGYRTMQIVPYFYKIQTLRYIIGHYVYRKITRYFLIFRKTILKSSCNRSHGHCFFRCRTGNGGENKSVARQKDNVTNVSVMYGCVMRYGDISHFPLFVFFLSRTNWKVLVDIVLRSMGTVSESQFVKYCFLLSSTIDFLSILSRYSSAITLARHGLKVNSFLDGFFFFTGVQHGLLFPAGN